MITTYLRIINCIKLLKYTSVGHHTSKSILCYSQCNISVPCEPFVISKKHFHHCGGNMTTAEGLNLSTVVQILTNFAPLSLAEPWDNVGLLIEPRKHRPIKKVLLTIDLAEDVMEEVLAVGADMVIAYHPPIFDSVKKFNTEKWQVRVSMLCIENKIAVFSPHTSWDIVKGGLTDWLSSPFEFAEIKPIKQAYSLETPTSSSALKYHVTAWTELPFANKLDQVLQNSGISLVSKLNVETDHRVTFYASEDQLPHMLSNFKEMLVRYEVVKREPVPVTGSGLGRVGKLKKPLSLQEIVGIVKTFLNMTHLRLAVARGKTIESTVETIAFVAGSGGTALQGVKVDLFITGEMLHHDILEANHTGTSIILINHSDSERGFLSYIVPVFQKLFQNKTEIVVSKVDRDPLITV